MKTVSADFQNHLDRETTTICNCWVLLRKDGLSLGFTDHDRGIEVEGTSCEPSSGFEASQMEESTGLAPANHDILGALMSDRISAADIESRKYDGARIRHYVVNWEKPSQHVLMQTYLFGEIAREDGTFRAELKSLVAQLDETNVRRFNKTCNAVLGDSACGVDLEQGHRHQATVDGTLSSDIIRIAGVEFLPANWLSGGRAVLRPGMAEEEAAEITLHVKNRMGQDEITLWQGPSRPLHTGDTLVVYPGCDKLIGTCREKFANALNFQGFPFMPGQDFATSYASNSNRMDGGPLIP